MINLFSRIQKYGKNSKVIKFQVLDSFIITTIDPDAIKVRKVEMLLLFYLFFDEF